MVTMDRKRVFKQVGIVLAVLLLIVVLILLLTFMINGPNRMLTSEELALEQTRISLEIFIKQTEVARTSAAELYLTLGVPLPTGTPFQVPTSGALGRPLISSPAPVSTSGAAAANTMPGQRTQSARTATPAPNTQPTLTRTVTLAPGQPTLTLTATASPTTTATPPTGWGGQWSAWFGAEFEDIQSGEMNLTVSGSSINGAAQFPGGQMTLTGEITADGQQVYGEYTYAAESGEFFWELVEDEAQFHGNADNNKRFCAARPGVPQPEQCGYYFEQ